MIAFGIFWFFLTLSVESSVIPIMDVIFEHRLYLPSVGAFIALATCWGMVAKRLGAKRKEWLTAAAALAGLSVLALAGATYARNEVWRSQERLWQDVVNKIVNAPRNPQDKPLKDVKVKTVKIERA